MTILFNRAGEAFDVAVQDGVKPMRGYQAGCVRCGGAGGSDKWAHTGWTCFDCNGSGRGSRRSEPLYTREQLDKLIARKAVADAKRAAAAQAKHAAEVARRVAERAELVAVEKQLLDRIACAVSVEADSFPAKIWRQVMDDVRPVSVAQREAVLGALDKIEAEKLRQTEARHVGVVGQRQSFELFFVRDMFFDNDFGGTYLTVARDAAGNTFAYWGNWNGLGFPTKFENGNRFVEPGVAAVVKAMVKDHRFNKKTGEPETIINRPTKARVAA